MNYSIRYKDAKGITIRSEFLPFGADGEASAYARSALPKNELIEVWHGDGLVVRLERDSKAAAA